MATLFAGVQTPEQYEQLPFWDAHHLAVEVLKNWQAERDLQIQLAGGKV